jgi:RsiW-degrading membrane proteinase PrsW (M82 family)
MGYPNERILKPVYLATAVFSFILIASVVLLRIIFPQWTLLPKAILLSIIVIDTVALALYHILRLKKRNRNLKSSLS